ncbi:hypothetical protein NQ314_016795, partial [Rhamnusium bicolor]
FRKHFRITKSTANIIIDEYKNSKFYFEENNWLRGTPMKTAETEIFLFLCDGSLLDIAPRYIKFPKSPEEKERLSDDFFKVSGFPSTLGCINGTSIPVITPSHKIKSTYVNRHDTLAITVQAICDHRKCFIDVFTGTPGKIHDSRVLKLSHVYKLLPNICGSNYHILGDSAYHIREWLLTPYRDFGNLDENERQFNKTFCATRVLIENSFGILKSRFRQLLQVQSVEKISKFIFSCCVLHNLCIMNCDELEQEECMVNCTIGDNIEGSNTEDTEVHLRKLGEIKRKFIKNRLTHLHT